MRLFGITAVLLVLAQAFAVSLVSPLLPAFAWIIESIDSRFRVDNLSIAERKHGTFVESKISLAQVLVITPNRSLLPSSNITFTPSLLLGNVLQPIIIVLAIVVAWPLASIKTLSLRLLVAIPACAILLAVNCPLSLIGALLDFREILPGAKVDLLAYWNDFLQTGGPLVLGTVAGVFVVLTGEFIEQKGALQISESS